MKSGSELPAFLRIIADQSKKPRAGHLRRSRTPSVSVSLQELRRISANTRLQPEPFGICLDLRQELCTRLSDSGRQAINDSVSDAALHRQGFSEPQKVGTWDEASDKDD